MLFAGSKQTVKHGTSTGGFVVARKQIIFSADGYGAYAVFYQVIVYA